MPSPTAPVINSVVFAANKLSATVKFAPLADPRPSGEDVTAIKVIATPSTGTAIEVTFSGTLLNAEMEQSVSGLDAAKAYTFKVNFLNSSGNTDSAIFTPVIIPSAPVLDATSPVVMAANRESATIKFAPGANPLVAGENIQKFVIEVVPALGGAAIEITGASILNGDMTKVVSGLSANVSYIFRVKAVALYGSAYSAYSAPQPIPVEVNLNVEITATGELELLSQQLQTPLNVVCATEKLLAASLYLPGTRALIEFWEDDAIDGVKAQLANSDFSANTPAGPNYSGYYLKSAKELAKGLQLVLCGEMHANKTVVRMDGLSKTFEASPFIGAPYKDANGAVINDHKIFNHFGRMALACYAHYLMGHQQATAAITNDKSFMAKMLDLDLTGLTDAQVEALLAPPVIAAGSTDEQIATAKSNAAAALYARYANKLNVEDANADPLAWALTAPAANANADLARRLVAKLLSLNLTAGAPKISTVNVANNNVPDADSGSVADIVDQVIGRDASRARSEDNSKYGPESHGLLRFYAGDVVYVNIKLTKPTVTVNSGQLVNGTTIASQYNEENYTIRIELA